jgi:lipopolysaccharide/colanic/teichoic acid biosynthesis glycosyltransferase
MGASALSFERELEYDEWYLKHWSLRLDVKILWRWRLSNARRI